MGQITKRNKIKRDLIPEEIRQANIDYCNQLVHIFKINTRLILSHLHLSFRGFWEVAARNGITTTRENFYSDRIKYAPNFLYLTTFSRIVGVPIYLLLDPKLPELLAQGKVKPCILERENIRQKQATA